MERFEGRAHLAWVANSSFALTADVHVEVTALENGWSARLTGPSEDARWVATVLDNPFELRFGDGSAFAVGVSGTDEDGALILWDWELEGASNFHCPQCGIDQKK